MDERAFILGFSLLIQSMISFLLYDNSCCCCDLLKGQKTNYSQISFSSRRDIVVLFKLEFKIK